MDWIEPLQRASARNMTCVSFTAGYEGGLLMAQDWNKDSTVGLGSRGQKAA